MNERDLFLSALEIEDPPARKAHLQSACGENLELLSRVESLLASHEGASRFLQTPVVEQLGEEIAATIVMRTGSTHDEALSQNQERNNMDEEIPLGYLEPSTKPGSLGRLGHYEILETVGHGAFGTVLRAFDEKLQRVVAIKVMAPELAATSPARKRFVREAVASAQIRHENVVSVYSVEEKPIPYLVMEFIPGLTLQQRLDERGPLDVPTVLRLGAQIAHGLAAAHAKDLIHRDIKPGNILLETGMRDRVKITDFGLARAADDASMTQSGTIAGTPMYMAPEQALGHKLDQRADLFSFGSVLYQMVSGRPPFRAASTLAALKRVTEDTPRPIQEIIPETPGWMCDIICKLHAKNPDQRFQSAMEVADILERHLAHLQNPSQIARPASVSLPPAAEKTIPAKPRKAPENTGPEMRPLMVPRGIRWPLLIASGIMLLVAVLLLAVTESTGVTHLFSGSRVVQGPSPPIVPKPDPIAVEFSGVAWKQLFNGKNLDGWAPNPDFPGNWRVEDGILVGAGSQLGMLQTARNDIENFHFRAEVLINSADADGGIFFRSLPQSSNELNLCFDPNLPTQQTGSLVIHKPSTKDSVWNSAPKDLAKANDWMTVEIIARGGQAVTKVNGQTAAESHALCGNPRGHIVLQHLGPQTVVRFRKIEIKELPAPPPLDGWVQLFNGKNLTGWKTRPDAPGNWEVKDGILIGSLRRGDLYSERGDYANFHLRAEAKINLGGDSGIFFRSGLGPLPENQPRQAGSEEGFEVEIHKNRSYARKTGTITALKTNGPPQILGLVADDALTQADEWFTLEIIADQDRFITKVNGKEAANCRDLLGKHSSGHLGLQVWNPNTLVQFRKIEIKELPANPIAKRDPLPPTYTNSIGMEFVIVPKGKSWLGGGKERLGDKEVEIPADFYLGKYELTQEEWEKVMGERPSHFSRTREGKETVKDISDADLKRYPVESVSWDQCQLFVAKLNRLENETGWVYRLPMDVEWEYACRGGPMSDKADSAFDFYLAKPTNTLLPEQANFNNGLNRTCKVGSFEPNRLGLFDMHGNVTEWCDETEKSTEGVSKRVHHGGGSWYLDSGYSRAANRLASPPSYRFNNLGLRLARVPSGAPSLEAPPPPSVAAPFVILAEDAAAEQKFATLAQAVAAAKERDTIEIRASGPFPTPPTVLGKSLTLRAAAGYRPVLVHTQDGSLLWAKAPLTLEGLEIHSLGNKHKVKESQVALVQTTQQPLRIAHCRFVVTGELVAIQTYASPLLEVVSSEIFSQDHNSIDLGLADKVKLVVQNCTLAGRGAIAFYQNGKPCQDAEIEFTGNTFVAAEWFAWSHRFFHEPVGAGQEPFRSLSIKAVGNVFQSRRSFAGVIHADPENPFRSALLCDWYRSHVAWEGRDNLYAVQGLYLICHESDKAPERQWNALKDWNEFWNVAKDSGMEGIPLFAGGDLVERIAQDPLKLTAADFRLKQGSPGQGSGPDGKNLGAAVDLVGPGEAYDKWCSTPDYQAWLEKTTTATGVETDTKK